MQTQVAVLSVAGGIVGLVSVILSIVAEKARTKPVETFDEEGFLYCDYPNSSVLGLAIAAALMLILAQVLLAIAGRCCGCCRTNASSAINSAVSIIISVFSWIAFVTSLILLVVGAIFNGHNGQHPKFGGSCFVRLPGVFGGAALLSFIAVSLGIGAALLLASRSSTTTGMPTYSRHGQGVEMGQPQFQVSPTGPSPVYGATTYK